MTWLIIFATKTERENLIMHDATLHFERILAAVSFRDKAVAKRATAVARCLGLGLRLVHIDEMSSPACRWDNTQTSSDRLESSRLAASMIDCDTPVEAVNLEGNPRHTLSALGCGLRTATATADFGSRPEA